MITQSPLRNHALDTLRALAILMVMLYHVGLGLPIFLVPLASIGWMGVDLFFLLSGYLIGTQLLRPATLGKSISLKNFYTRRAWRILPAYLVVLALYFFAPSLSEYSGFASLWRFLTFTWNLHVNYVRDPAFVQVWSLCVEEHFYLFLPLLTIAFLRRPSARKTAAAAAFIVLVGVAMRALAVWHLRALPEHTDAFRAVYYEQIYFPTWTRLDGLLAGVLLAATQLFRPRLWQELLNRASTLFPISLGCILLAAILFYSPAETVGARAVAGMLFGFPILSLGLACLLACSLAPQSPFRHRVPGGRQLATLAFSLYLTNSSVFHLVQLQFPILCKSHPVLALPIYAIAALTVASVLYFAVERPCLIFRDRRRNPDIEALANPAI
jgi:peptidoglycan/LPS O-acetylase OafA/YrhL